ncbi:MAG: sodium:alanine symporter family protein [Candidatus Aminicenantes bacterium]|nr:sodium:alanine symporter family protein [Candidatus Aminicenantes bacterium]
MDKLLNIIQDIDSILWGPWTMGFLALTALYFSVASGFFQIRRFPFICKNTIGKISEKQDVLQNNKITPFQAATTALASTVGMGNIAGVATALSVGGPGAIFWMWLLALLGMMTKTAEITLAVHYRETDKSGLIHGGPMYYITKGLGWTFLAKLFSIGVLVNSILTATLLQSHTVGRAFLSSYGISPYLITLGMAVITGIVIIGGIKRIGVFCERLVPLMSLLYIAGGAFVFIINYHKIPEVFTTIFKFAFAPAPAVGGFAGAAVTAAIKNGMARGMLSNEAGLGTAPMIHAAADTPHPFRQGLWGAFEVFIDTMVICTITSFAIISTGVLSQGESGIELVISAFSSVLPEKIAASLLSFSIMTFCLTTQIGFFIYYETSLTHLFGKKVLKYFKWFYLLPGIIFAGVTNVDKLWTFANISVGLCSLPNLVAVLALSSVFFRLMYDHMSGRNAFATHIIDESHDYIKKRIKTNE